jgi:hypothetical protein
MHFSLFRRSTRSWQKWLRPALLLLLGGLILDFTLSIGISHCATQNSSSATPFFNESRHIDRIFIASMHWNSEAIIRSHWSAAVVDLVRYFGPENVYVSIVESGGLDDTTGALRELDLQLETLGVERSIETHMTSHKEEVDRIPDPEEEGWVWTSRGKKELRRIPYLAGIRNQVMDKLMHLARRTDPKGKRVFDKILWLNDVIFTVSSCL